MGLQNFDDNVADCSVRGDNVKFVWLLDVDGKVGDGLIIVVQHNLGLFVAHAAKAGPRETGLGSGQGRLKGPALSNTLLRK